MYSFSFLNTILLIIFFLAIKAPPVIAGKLFTGTAVAPIVESLSSGSDASYYGTVKHVAKRGSLIEPSITDINGNILIPGTIVMQQGTKYWKAMVDADQANILTSEQDLLTATENLKRYQKLAPSGAESIEDYQLFQNNYYKYLGIHIQDQGTLLLDQEVLDSRTQYAPFEGYVKNVMYSIGRASGNPETIEIVQLNPIGIKIKMKRETANKITPATPVTIYLPGKNKTQGVFNGFSILCEDGIIFLTENRPKELNLTDKEMKEIKFKINDCYPVDFFYINNSTNKTLCVPKPAIQNDSKGYYVWKAEDRKFLVPGKSFHPVFKVVKEYVSPGKLQRLFAGDIYVRSLNKSGNLSFGDVVLSPPPKGIKDGDMVSFSPKRYIFMPGEQVKVEIDIPKGIYF